MRNVSRASSLKQAASPLLPANDAAPVSRQVTSVMVPLAITAKGPKLDGGLLKGKHHVPSKGKLHPERALPKQPSREAIEEGLLELRSVRAKVTQAAEAVGVEPAAVAKVLKPSEVLKGEIDVRLSDGSTVRFPYFRIRFGRPGKGGIRFMKSVTREQIEALALEMDLKIRIAGLPLRGAKGGVGPGEVVTAGKTHQAGAEVPPESLSLEDRKAIMRAYRRAFGPDEFGPAVDVPAPDLNTNEDIMGAFLEADAAETGLFRPATVTGKSVITDAQGEVQAHGGNVIRGISTGLGMAFHAERCAAEVGLTLRGSTAVVQGAGEVGMAAAMALHERGVKVIAISDANGAIHHPKGIDIAALKRHHEEHKTVVGFPGAEQIPGSNLLSLTADIVMPAALSNQIHEGNALEIVRSGTTHGRPKIVIEGANGASTFKGAELLDQHGLFVVPDVLGNIGGVVVSYFEEIQNTTGRVWTAEESTERLRAITDQAFDRALRQAKKHGVGLRTGATMNAVRELVEIGQNQALKKDKSLDFSYVDRNGMCEDEQFFLDSLVAQTSRP